MSHFAVLVLTKPDETIEDALQPYHEYECTGTDDQYVQDVDITAEARESYEKSKERRYKDPQGILHEPYQDRFYRDPTEEEKSKVGIGGTGFGGGISYTSKDWGDGKGYRPKVHFMPEGWEEVMIPQSEAESMAEYISSYYGIDIVKEGEKNAEGGKYGYVIVNEQGDVVKAIDRTNPNAKWDWWMIGGRYSGKLLVKAGADGIKGRDSLVAGGMDDNGIDQCLIGDLDHDAMLKRNRDGIERHYRKTHAKVLERNPEMTWEVWNKLCRDSGPAVDRLRKLWDEAGEGKGAFHAFINRLKEEGNADAILVRLAGENGVDSWDGIDKGEDLEVALANTRSLSSFAVLKDGQWYERGEMGWWGSVSNEKDGDVWDAKLDELLKDLPADMTITVVDCHI